MSLLLNASWVPPAHAHRAPIPIALWGGFETPAARCQRLIGAVAARCGLAAWAARNACLAAQVSGTTCDTGAADAAVSQAHLTALDMVDHGCSDTDLDRLSFSLTLDVDADIDGFCSELENAAVSAVYGPALRGGIIRTVDGTTQACIDVTARATSKLLRFAFRAVQQALDRIASRSLLPTQKIALLDQAAARIARARGLLEADIATACPDTAFASVYHREAGPFLTAVGQRSDCLGGSAYTQGAVLCPPPVCGNGMREHNEQCDDGNLTDSDGCSNHCLIEPQPSAPLVGGR